MRQGMPSRQKHLRHVAFAFVAGGLLTYMCISILGRAGPLEASGKLCHILTAYAYEQDQALHENFVSASHEQV